MKKSLDDIKKFIKDINKSNNKENNKDNNKIINNKSINNKNINVKNNVNSNDDAKSSDNASKSNSKIKDNTDENPNKYDDTIPMRFRDIVIAITKNGKPYFDELKSTAILLEEYLKNKRNMIIFNYTSAGKALSTSYALLRLSMPIKTFFEPITSRSSNDDKVVKTFYIYTVIMLWLRERLEIDDTFLDINLRLKFYEILSIWSKYFIDRLSVEKNAFMQEDNVISLLDNYKSIESNTKINKEKDEKEIIDENKTEQEIEINSRNCNNSSKLEKLNTKVIPDPIEKQTSTESNLNATEEKSIENDEDIEEFNSVKESVDSIIKRLISSKNEEESRHTKPLSLINLIENLNDTKANEKGLKFLLEEKNSDLSISKLDSLILSKISMKNLNYKFQISSPLVYIFKLHRLLLHGIMHLPNIEDATMKLTRIEVKSVLTLDSELYENKSENMLTVKFLDENIYKGDATIIKLFFTAYVYNVFSDIQIYLFKILTNFLDEFDDFRFLILKINFFSDNTLIENIIRKSNVNSKSEKKSLSYLVGIYGDLRKHIELVLMSIDGFQLTTWGLPVLQSKKFDVDIFIKLYIIEFQALHKWYDTGGQREYEFMRITVTVRETLNFLSKRTMQFLYENIDKIFKKFQHESNDTNENDLKDIVNIFHLDLIYWLSKAYVYNLLSFSLHLTRKFYDYLKHLGINIRRFALLLPGWYQIIKLYKYFELTCDEVYTHLSKFENNEMRIKGVFSVTRSIIKKLFRSIYIKLCMDWIDEFIELNHLYKMNKHSKPNLPKIYKLHFIIGIPFLFHFHDIFRYHYSLIRDKINKIIKYEFEKIDIDFFQTFFEELTIDSYAVYAENPFIFQIAMNALKSDISLENFKLDETQETRLYPTNLNALDYLFNKK